LVVLKLDKGVNFRSLPIKPNVPYVLSRLSYYCSDKGIMLKY
jgi:hypothetical protein